MVTVKEHLDLARRYIGTTESPAGSNRQPFAKMAGHANGYAWCATFGVAMQKALGMDVVADSAYTPTCANMAAKAGRTVAIGDAMPGDHAVVDFPGGLNRIEHYVIIEKPLGGGRFQTIEGNTSGGGSQTNGGAVLRKTRNFNTMRRYVIWRPWFTGAPAPDDNGPVRPEGALIARGDSGGTVIIWQQQLRDQQFAPSLVADGDFGPLTEAATRYFQSQTGLPSTGWVGQRDIDAMQAAYNRPSPPAAQEPPGLAVAVRYASGYPADERMARALAGAMNLHVASLDSRQRVGRVYLVGGHAVEGFDRELAGAVVELAGATRQHTWAAVGDAIEEYIASI